MTPPAEMRRCFVCAADMLAPTTRRLVADGRSPRSFPYACGSCGVLLAAGADPTACWDDLAGRLARPEFTPDPDAPYGLDIYTLRIAATRIGRGVRPLGVADRAALLHPHAERPAHAATFPLAGAERRPVSLGVMCRAADREAVHAGLAAHGEWCDDVVVLLDAPPSTPAEVGRIRVATRPLAGDFAAQRNALHDLARHPWMLQLDADETLDPDTAALLPAVAAMADVGDVLSVGLARRNLVDGVLSDVFPDVQYRLNRTGVRYRGRVHERPAPEGGWPRSFITLHGAIQHHLDGAHVRARSRRYEALDPGRGRPEEEAALLRPFRP